MYIPITTRDEAVLLFDDKERGLLVKYGIYLRGFKPYTSLELRQSLIRIPEVLIELKKIQQVYDIGQETVRDVLTDFLSEEGYSHLSIAMERLISASVQKGLVQRAVKRLGPPTFAISSSDSLPLQKFIFGQHVEMERFLYEPSVQGIKESDQLNTYEVIQLINEEGKSCFENIELQISSAEELLMDLIDQLYVRRLVTVTVPEDIRKSFYHASAGEKLIVQDVIETDPFLGWFDYQMLRAA